LASFQVHISLQQQIEDVSESIRNISISSEMFKMVVNEYSTSVARKFNNKFWEELIAYFLFTEIRASNMMSRRKTSACMGSEVKQYNLGDCNVGVTDGSDL
jgi:hypothetical protein